MFGKLFSAKEEKKEVEYIAAPPVYEGKTLYNPVMGEVIQLSDVSDPAFSSKAVGDGIAVFPSEGKIYSPVNGKISTLFHTNHALGLVSEDGLEILLHIGIETVGMEGEGFEAFVKQGDTVKAGQLLVEFDIKKICEKELEPTVIILVLNYAAMGEMWITQEQTVKPMDKLVSFR